MFARLVRSLAPNTLRGTAAAAGVGLPLRPPTLPVGVATMQRHTGAVPFGSAAGPFAAPPPGPVLVVPIRHWRPAGAVRTCTMQRQPAFRALGSHVLSYAPPSYAGVFGRVLAPQRRSVCGKKRLRWKMSKHRYIKKVKKVRYISAIPQYTGPLGRQTKKRPCIKDYRKMPRLRQFKRER
eukprot:NODE_13778_length_1147_cov_4.854902.p1 GENE.NODE_13778_length_1147_cov_4.854902~~NODE_13778_length_1147_cov_4.854902.p1  ORF type:complete len:180 (-),score=16.20 NODE_13778_length_1147_cov_4.854902:527-1066(-)